MLPFRVTQIEQRRALQQKAAPLSVPDICRPNFRLVSRPASSRKRPKLNRQIPELYRAVTLRKQTAITCSNRQKIQKCLQAFSARISSLSAQNFAGSNPRDRGRSTRENPLWSQSGCTTSIRPALRLLGGFALIVLSQGYDWPRHTSNRAAVHPALVDEIFGVRDYISARFCSIYRMRRNLLKTNDRDISTRGHNRMPRSHEFRPISTKVVIEKL